MRGGIELAAAIPLRPQVVTYPLHGANRALHDLWRGDGCGAKVLTTHWVPIVPSMPLLVIAPNALTGGTTPSR